MIGPVVGIADMVRAVDVLKPYGRAQALVAGLCGLSLTIPEQPSDMTPSVADETEAVDVELMQELQPATSAAAQTLSLPGSIRRLTPTRHGTAFTTASDPVAAAESTEPASPPRFEGLFSARDAAELWWLAASVLVAGDQVDLNRVTTRLALAQPLTALPRLAVPCVALGVQLLLDVGLSMQPFIPDQLELLRRLGIERQEGAQVRYFVEDPSRGVGRERRKRGWRPYTPPSPGTPVVVISDLGCGFPRRPQAAADWLAFARRLRRLQCRLVVFAPVQLARVPPRLCRWLEIIVWDRSNGRRNAARLGRLGDG